VRSVSSTASFSIATRSVETSPRARVKVCSYVEARRVELRARDALLRDEASAREEGSEEARADGPRAPGREEVVEARADAAEESREAQRGVERRARDADARVRGDQLLFGRAHVGPVEEKRRRQAPRGRPEGAAAR
jgi:hypothetical protein